MKQYYLVMDFSIGISSELMSIILDFVIVLRKDIPILKMIFKNKLFALGSTPSIKE